MSEDDVMATVDPQSSPVPFAATRFLVPGTADDLLIPSSAHTLHGFRQWILSEAAPAHGQFTFAAGELIVDMSPEAYETHNCIKSEVGSVIYFFVKQQNLGRFFGDRFLLSNSAAGISTEPDATFAGHDAFRAGRCQIVRSGRPGVSDELVGSPDWVLEILSRSSIDKDKKLLFDGYFRAGVREYWLIDALDDKLEFQVFTPGASSFVPVTSQSGWLASSVFGRMFRLTREKAADGIWQYTLHVQESS